MSQPQSGSSPGHCSRMTAEQGDSSRATSHPDRDLELAVLAEDLGARRPPPAVEEEIDRRVAHAQVADRDLTEPCGQVGPDELELMPFGDRPQPEHRPEEEEWRPGGPGLWRAGDRVRHGDAHALALEAAEELRQPEVREMLGRLEDAA